MEHINTYVAVLYIPEKSKYTDIRHTDTRYCIIDSDTHEILDTNKGYGYETRQDAYANFKKRGDFK